MEVIDSETTWEDRAFYFAGHIVSPVAAKLWHFRSEDEYDSNERAETMAMNLIRSFSKCIEKRAFLLLTSDIGLPTAVRRKKGVLWDHKTIRQLQHITFETECEEGKTRVGALVDLSGFGFDCEPSALLNWIQGIIVLSDEPLETVEKLVKQWVSRTDRSTFPYDYDAVAGSLQQNAMMGILRYLPPSGSRPETVVVVANEKLVHDGACECIDAITT